MLIAVQKCKALHPLHQTTKAVAMLPEGEFHMLIINLEIVKDLPLYKGIRRYGHHGVAAVSNLVS